MSSSQRGTRAVRTPARVQWLVFYSRLPTSRGDWRHVSSRLKARSPAEWRCACWRRPLLPGFEQAGHDFRLPFCQAQVSQEQGFLLLSDARKKVVCLSRGGGPLLRCRQVPHLEREVRLAQLDLSKDVRSVCLRLELAQAFPCLIRFPTRMQQAHLEQQPRNQEIEPEKLTLSQRLVHIGLCLGQRIPFVGKRGQVIKSQALVEDLPIPRPLVRTGECPAKVMDGQMQFSAGNAHIPQQSHSDLHVGNPPHAFTQRQTLPQELPGHRTLVVKGRLCSLHDETATAPVPIVLGKQ